MKATQRLPENYTLHGVFDIHNVRLALLLNVVGIGLLFLFGWLFMAVADRLNDSFALMGLGQIFSLLSWWGILLALLVVIVLHELSHGLFFWLFSGERPFLGIGPGYAYAAAPGWYFPRNQFLLIGLAPLVLISGLGLLLLPFTNQPTAAWIVLTLTANAGGAVGDLAICGWLLTRPANTLTQDEGPVMRFYQPAISTQMEK